MRVASNSNQFIPNATWDESVSATCGFHADAVVGVGRSAAILAAMVVQHPARATASPCRSKWATWVRPAFTCSGRFTTTTVCPAGPSPTSTCGGRFPDLGFVQAVEVDRFMPPIILFRPACSSASRDGFTLLAAFSWEKSIDTGSGIRQATGDAYVPPNGADLRSERSVSAFNFGKKLTVSGLWELPFGRGKKFGGGVNRLLDLLRGRMAVGRHLHDRGRLPIRAACQNGAVVQNTDGPCRPDATGITPNLREPDPAQWFNPAAFVNRLDFVTNVGPYRYGNSQRNNLIGPGLLALDASLFKSFRPTERVKLDFRAEFFNLPNHPNFGQPNATVGGPSYTRITATRTDGRQIQLGLRLTF